MINKYLNISVAFVFCSLLIALCATGFIIYLMVFERAYLSYPDLPIKVLKKNVYPGEILPLKVMRCSASSKQQLFMTSRFMSNAGGDQEVLVLEPLGVVVQPGCLEKIVMFTRIPESARPGRYQLSGAASIQGIIRDFSVDWYTEPFTVLEKPALAGGSPGTQGGIK